jgi:hypothetical protein
MYIHSILHMLLSLRSGIVVSDCISQWRLCQNVERFHFMRLADTELRAMICGVPATWRRATRKEPRTFHSLSRARSESRRFPRAWFYTHACHWTTSVTKTTFSRYTIHISLTSKVNTKHSLSCQQFHYKTVSYFIYLPLLAERATWAYHNANASSVEPCAQHPTASDVSTCESGSVAKRPTHQTILILSTKALQISNTF